MSEKKDRVLGNELKIKSIKKDRDYLQRLNNKEEPEKTEAQVIDFKKNKNSQPSVVEETPVFLPIGGGREVA